MKIRLKQSLTVNNKKYFFTLTKLTDRKCFFECESANISQEFLNEDIPALIFDLPQLILAEKDYQKHSAEVIRFRVSAEDKKAIEKKALERGYKSVSGFLRDVALG